MPPSNALFTSDGASLLEKLNVVPKPMKLFGIGDCGKNCGEGSRPAGFLKAKVAP